MDILYAVIVVVGLVVFETIASIDNAIINADILSTMSAWAKRWFLTWGLIIAVFGVRGILPWLIIWFSTPSLGPIGALTATFSDDATAAAAIEASAPFLLLAGGMFMVLLFLHWLMAEQKNCIVPGELALSKQGPWFYAVAAILLLVIVYFAVQINPFLGVAAVAGFAIYFVMMGFRLFADKKSAELEKGSSDPKAAKHSDLSKLVLLEVIDASFSIDGVVGAFAFTMSVPLILIGNGKRNTDFLHSIILKKELNIFGSRNAFTKDFEELIDLVASGKVDVMKMVSGIYKKENAQEAFESLKNNDGSLCKLLIEF